MAHRIIWSYLGALGLPMLFLPIAVFNDVDGDLLWYATFLSSDVGVMVALADHDSRLHLDNRRKLFRSVLAFVLLLSVVVLLWAWIGSPLKVFDANNPWRYAALPVPAAAALLSGAVFGQSKETPRAKL